MSASTSAMVVTAVPNVPRVRPGDALEGVVCDALDSSGLVIREHDVIVLAQKIVSKAQNRYVDLATVVPSATAVSIAEQVQKDPRLVDVILSESVDIVRAAPGVLIVEHQSGVVMANAGVDRSNLDSDICSEPVLLLPNAPDDTCDALRSALARRYGVQVGVIICDSVGRAWRNGTVALAIGCAGITSLLDLRGREDLNGRELEVSEIGFADQISSAAALLMGEAAEGNPVVIVSGLRWPDTHLSARALVRERERDLFR